LIELKVFFIDVKFGRWAILIICIRFRVYKTIEEEISPSLTYSPPPVDTGKLRHSHTVNWIEPAMPFDRTNSGPVYSYFFKTRQIYC